MPEFLAAGLTATHVSTDGEAVRLGFVDRTGQAGTLVLPAECLSALIMTLPALAAAALRARYGDPTLKIVYPLAKFRLDATEDAAVSILTLATPDGFEVSFSLQSETASALHAATDLDVEAPPRLQ